MKSMLCGYIQEAVHRFKKHTIASWVVAILLLVCFTPVRASADIGPKSSVTVTVNGVEEGQVYYATLLSKYETNGPDSAYDGGYARYEQGEKGYEIWKKFVEYEDKDGYYFLQEFWTCSGSDAFRWGYYPPNPFKILLYFPEQEAFVVSNIYERYAFDTYYTVDLSGMDISAVSGVEPLGAEKSYDYTWELVSLGVRIVLTIALELVVAYLLCLRQKNQLQLFFTCNVVTQIVLNVLLNIVNYNKGPLAFSFYYVLWEFIVFAIEAVLYSMVLNKPAFGQVLKAKAVLYSLLANAVSFAVGLWLAHLIPGIF